jgi:hypothetical protein
MGLKVGKRSNGTDSLNEFFVFGFEGLLNIDSLPHNLSDNDLSMALNVYGDVPGGVRMRRGMNLRNVAIGTSPILGLTRFFQQVVHGASVSPPTTKTLAQVGGTLWNYDTNTQIGSTGALGSTPKSWTVVRVYDPDNGSGATDSLVICTGSGGPYLYDGTTITTPSGWSAAAGAQWCTLSNGTLWFAGIPAQPTLLWQAQPQHPTLYGNSFVASYPITGLSSLGAGSQSGVVYGMTRGVGVTFGVNLYNLYNQEIPFHDGVTAGRTMIAVDGIVYFLGDTNIYKFDGQSITPVANKVRPWIVNDPTKQEFPMNGVRELSFSWYYDQFIYFAYDSGSLGYCQTYLVYHLTNGEWTVLSGPKLSCAALLNSPYVDSDPHQCIVGDATTGKVYDWDQYIAGTHNVADNGVPIQTLVLTKYFRLSGPGSMVSLKQVVPELFLDSVFAGNLQISLDYGLGSYPYQLSGTGSLNTTWNDFNWDEANWSGGSNLTFFTQAVDIDPSVNSIPEANSIAFGVATSDTNPPYTFCGVSGEFSPCPRRTPSMTGGF